MIRAAFSTGFVLIALLITSGVRADVRPDALFTEGMVLQQGRDVCVWGNADAGEKVVVRFRDQEAATVAEAGRWLVRIKSGAAGGPFPMTIAGKNTLAFKNVRVGEVWLCSGQSNMWFPYAQRPGSRELIGTENPDIRLFTVPQRKSDSPQPDLADAAWQECGPETVGNFSAVAYHFGRELQKTLKVPVGLIHASYGGSSVMLWLNPEAAEKQLPVAPTARAKPVTPVLYNGMIAPLVPFGIRGVIWYQGEADTRNAAGYRVAFPAMIRGWRTQWAAGLPLAMSANAGRPASADSSAGSDGDFPFLFVQIAPYLKIVAEPQESIWAELRAAQLYASQTVPNTAMVVITDWGHEADIHVKPKKPVGERLALTARALVYGEKIEYSGPVYTAMKAEGSKIALTFTHIGGGMETRTMVRENPIHNARTNEDGIALHVKPAEPGAAPAPLQGFTIAGDDHTFVNAHAEISGNTVTVWSDSVAHPVAVRYGWADYPVGNLFNKEGLPASPFRTDDFPLKGSPAPRQ